MKHSVNIIKHTLCTNVCVMKQCMYNDIFCIYNEMIGMYNEHTVYIMHNEP